MREQPEWLEKMDDWEVRKRLPNPTAFVEDLRFRVHLLVRDQCTVVIGTLRKSIFFNKPSFQNGYIFTFVSLSYPLDEHVNSSKGKLQFPLKQYSFYKNNYQ